MSIYKLKASFINQKKVIIVMKSRNKQLNNNRYGQFYNW